MHEKDRPYPITSPAFSNVPLVGPILAATIGKLVKPVRRMHTDEWDGGQDYTLYSSRLEPRGPDALAPSVPKEEFSLWHAFKREVVNTAERLGPSLAVAQKLPRARAAGDRNPARRVPGLPNSMPRPPVLPLRAGPGLEQSIYK